MNGLGGFPQARCYDIRVTTNAPDVDSKKTRPKMRMTVAECVLWTDQPATGDFYKPFHKRKPR
jgi:hypothetical protein